MQLPPGRSVRLFESIRLPEVIGQPLHISKEGWDTHWRYSPDWLAPLFWYFSSMEFPSDTLSERLVGITWLELMFDFACSTFIIPAPLDAQNERDGFRLSDHFASAARRVFTLCGTHIKNFAHTDRRIPATAALDLPDAQGFFPRPLLRQPTFVASNMLRVIRSNSGNKFIAKIGEIFFQFPTRPVWEPGRSALPRRRLRSKQQQPADWDSYCSPTSSAALPPGTTMPTQRAPRTAPTAQQLSTGEWTQDELESINSFPKTGGYQIRERKRLVHNRCAAANSWHVIASIGVGDTHVTCRNCDTTTVVGQLSFWLKPGSARNCYGNAAPRLILQEVRKRNLMIDAHNAVCDASRKHTIGKLTHLSDRLECGRCGEHVPLSNHSFQDFRKERCLAKGCTEQERKAISVSRAPRYRLMAGGN